MATAFAHGRDAPEPDGESGIRHSRHEGVEADAHLAVVCCGNHPLSSMASLRQIRRSCCPKTVIPRTEGRGLICRSRPDGQAQRTAETQGAPRYRRAFPYPTRGFRNGSREPGFEKRSRTIRAPKYSQGGTSGNRLPGRLSTERSRPPADQKAEAAGRRDRNRDRTRARGGTPSSGRAGHGMCRYILPATRHDPHNGAAGQPSRQSVPVHLYRLGRRPPACHRRGRISFPSPSRDHADGATLGRLRRTRRPAGLRDAERDTAPGPADTPAPYVTPGEGVRRPTTTGASRLTNHVRNR